MNELSNEIYKRDNETNIVDTILHYADMNLARSRYVRSTDDKEKHKNEKIILNLLNGIFSEMEVGRCLILERRTSRVLTAKVQHDVQMRTKFTVRLSDWTYLGDIILDAHQKGTIEAENRHMVEILSLDGGTTTGPYRGAGTALVQVAAEIASMVNCGLFAHAVEDAWEFYFKNLFTTGSKESDDKLKAQKGRKRLNDHDIQIETMRLDASGWVAMRKQIDMGPILKHEFLAKYRL